MNSDQCKRGMCDECTLAADCTCPCHGDPLPDDQLWAYACEVRP